MPFEPRCPTCRQAVVWEGNPHRPFCCRRCRLADLGAWVSGEYRVAGDAIDPDAEEDGGSRGEKADE